MKSFMRILLAVCVLAIFSTSATASVSESNNTPGYIKKVVMRSIVDGMGCYYYYTFTCEHYLSYGESMAYQDFDSSSGDCVFRYYYWVDSITWIPVSGPAQCPAWALDAMDADHTSRTRQVLRSAGSGSMIVVGEGQTVNLSVSYEGGCNPPSGYPIWSGTGVSSSGTNATWTGNSSSTVTVQANPNDQMSISIQVVSNNQRSVSLSADQLWISQITQKIRDGVQTITNTSTDFNISGTIGGTYKKVCLLNNAEGAGNYLTLSGGMSGSFGGFTVTGPPIPLGASGFNVKLKAGTNGLNCSVTGSGGMDESQSGAQTLQLKASASSSFTVGLDLAYAADVLVVSLTGGTTITLDLNSSSNDFPKIRATGSISAAALKATLSAKVKIGSVWSLQVYEGEHNFGSAVSYPLDFTIWEP